jgi:hypothetical protein
MALPDTTVGAGPGDKSPLLARMKKLIREFNVWVEPAT